MTCTPMLLFLRAFDCPPCNAVMQFFPKIVEKASTDPLLKNLAIAMTVGSLAIPVVDGAWGRFYQDT